MFKTKITELFDIKYPILQGSMLWLSRAELVAAISNNGGLGVISSATFSTAEELRAEIRKTKSMTSNPFAVNLTILPTIQVINYEKYINVAIEEGVKIIETAGRSPEPYMKLLKDARIKTIHKVARVKDAKTAERIGVDAVTIVGIEAAGHLGMDNVTSLVLIPIAVGVLKIPVIAGGGIGDAKGLVAALALGAEGVVMGTRFMVSQECVMHSQIKQILIDSAETDTILIERSINNTARVIKADYSQKIQELEKQGTTLEELLWRISSLRSKQALEQGDINAGIIHCGQVVGMINEAPTVKEIIDGIIGQTRLIGQRLISIGILT
ncbi:NAD(P)H-dependent flavin oxidoreductase [Chloroflexota bacterium]